MNYLYTKKKKIEKNVSPLWWSGNFSEYRLLDGSCARRFKPIDFIWSSWVIWLAISMHGFFLLHVPNTRTFAWWGNEWTNRREGINQSGVTDRRNIITHHHTISLVISRHTGPFVYTTTSKAFFIGVFGAELLLLVTKIRTTVNRTIDNRSGPIFLLPQSTIVLPPTHNNYNTLPVICCLPIANLTHREFHPWLIRLIHWTTTTWSHHRRLSGRQSPHYCYHYYYFNLPYYYCQRQRQI